MPAVSPAQQRLVYAMAARKKAWAQRWLDEGHTKPVKRKLRKVGKIAASVAILGTLLAVGSPSEAQAVTYEEFQAEVEKIEAQQAAKQADLYARLKAETERIEAAQAAAPPVMADANGSTTGIPTGTGTTISASGWKCKWYGTMKVCWQVQPDINVTQQMSPYTHPWNLAANNYWGVGSWCLASSVQIIWVYEPGAPWLGAATMDGCWTGARYVWLNSGYPNVSIAGQSNARTWCTIVVHEWGHLIGLRWEYCPAGWVHECTDPNSIMYYRGINHIAAGC